MTAKLTRNHFKTEAEALAEIEAAGYFPVTIAPAAEANDDHWHDFDSMLFMLEGALTVTEVDSGKVTTYRPGDRVVAPAGVLHRETHDGFRAVVGLSVDPATLTQPINKAPPVTL